MNRDRRRASYFEDVVDSPGMIWWTTVSVADAGIYDSFAEVVNECFCRVGHGGYNERVW